MWGTARHFPLFVLLAVATSVLSASSASVGCGYEELKAAIAAAPANGSVNISCTRVVKSSGALILSKSITITGNKDFVLDGQGKNNLFSIKKGVKATLQDMTIQNGKGSNGGCIFAESSSEITLVNLNVQKCIASNGAGFYSSPSNKNVIKNCRFVQNIASVDGGGAFISKKSITLITGSEFTENSAERGGGIRKSAEDYEYWKQVGLLFTLQDSMFSKNVATTTSDRAGGGVSFHSGEYLVERTKFIENEATNTDAGGFYSLHSDGIWRDSVFIGNKAPKGIGGAMRVDGTTGRYKNIKENKGGGSIHFNTVSFFDNMAARSGAIWLCLYDASEGNDKGSIINSTWCGNSLNSDEGKCTGPGFYCGGAGEVIRNRFGSDHVPSKSKVKSKDSRSFCDTHDVTTIKDTKIPGYDNVPFTEDDSICAPWKQEAFARLNRNISPRRC